jgi:hypothetical protein
MVERALYTVVDSVVADLRRENTPQIYRGFELLVPESLRAELQALLDWWFVSYSGSYALRHIRRYITGFGMLESRFAVRSQPVSAWIFVHPSGLPPAERFFRGALRRSIERRYLLSGIRRSWLSRRTHLSHSARATDTLLGRTHMNLSNPY